ncbi:MAG: DUF4157 domain-containing protein [Crocinitomicaceae bacterium]
MKSKEKANKPPIQQKAINNAYSLEDSSNKSTYQSSLNSKYPPIQTKVNKTGLPDQLKSGMENLSGTQLDDVKVHRNSEEPAQMNAHAFAQGSNIHLAKGQEKHLPHELAHVVQQKKGHVKATTQLKGKVDINDNPTLEREADEMGKNALLNSHSKSEPITQTKSSSVIQKAKKGRGSKRIKSKGNSPSEQSVALESTHNSTYKNENHLDTFEPSLDNVQGTTQEQKLALRKMVTIRRCLKDMRNMLESGYGKDSAKALGAALVEIGIQVGAALIPVAGFGGVIGASAEAGGMALASAEMLAAKEVALRGGNLAGNLAIAGGMSSASTLSRTLGHIPMAQASEDDFQNLQQNIGSNSTDELISDKDALTGTTTKGRLGKMAKESAFGTGYKYGGKARQKIRHLGRKNKKTGRIQGAAANMAGFMAGTLSTGAHMAKDMLYTKTSKPLVKGAGGLAVKAASKMGNKKAKNRMAYVSASMKGPMLKWLKEDGGFDKLRQTLDLLYAQSGAGHASVSNYTNFLKHHDVERDGQLKKIHNEFAKLLPLVNKKWKKHGPVYKEILESRSEGKAPKGSVSATTDKYL